MTMQQVESSFIDEIGYDSQHEACRVVLKSGRDYTFYGVSAEDWDAFRNAPSIGTHFNLHIKTKGGAR